jgi:hypothetical protein
VRAEALAIVQTAANRPLEPTEARKLDRLVFGESGRRAVDDVADAVGR